MTEACKRDRIAKIERIIAKHTNVANNGVRGAGPMSGKSGKFASDGEKRSWHGRYVARLKDRLKAAKS